LRFSRRPDEIGTPQNDREKRERNETDYIPLWFPLERGKMIGEKPKWSRGLVGVVRVIRLKTTFSSLILLSAGRKEDDALDKNWYR
jgi:hypothetical protein